MIRRLLLLVLAAVLLSGCSRGPDASQVQAAVENRLQAVFAKPVLDVESLRRLGSGPLADAPDGAPRRIVYFNGRFRLARDYAFGDWQSLNPAALATLLGATERGVEGIARDGNRAGDLLQVRGSVTFREGPDGWQAVDFVPPPQATASQAAAGSPARTTIERIQNLFNTLPPNSPRARAIITEELAAADRQITRRLDRLRRAFVVAGGPEAGEYDLVARTIAARLTAQGFSASGSSTQGSIENLQLLQRGAANIALAQGDIARQAYQGQGAFGGTAHNPDLRAIASLYPEAFHIAVLADGPVQSIADLRGRRLDAGLAASGTRASTLQVLAAHGLPAGSVELVSSSNFDQAVRALVDKQVDAIASVIHAPARHCSAWPPTIACASCRCRRRRSRSSRGTIPPSCASCSPPAPIRARARPSRRWALPRCWSRAPKRPRTKCAACCRRCSNRPTSWRRAARPADRSPARPPAKA